MTNQSAPEIKLLRAAYAAFNARDIDKALALMTPDVSWPRAFKGGFVRGPEEIRAYWTEQWSEIDGHVEPVAFHHPAVIGKGFLLEAAPTLHGVAVKEQFPTGGSFGCGQFVRFGVRRFFGGGRLPGEHEWSCEQPGSTEGR